MAELRLKNVTKRFGAFVGVDNFDLTIADQEFLVLLGPSGCGKSTTMRMIAGLEDVTEGEIWLGDRMVNRLEPKDRDISMVFQSYGLYPNLSVYENIRFPLKVRKVPKAEHHERVMRAAEMVELTDLLERRPAALSGGQRQRVALGRAIVRKPTVFLMDEPLSNLDAKLRVSTRAQIKNLQHTLKTTTVYVTHDQIEAMTLADRIAIMRAGKIQQLGSPDEIYNRPITKYVAEFIGSPSMNFFEGKVDGDSFVTGDLRLPTAGYGWKGAQTDGPAWLGIRPEHVATGAAAADKPFHQEITVDLFEPMGSDTLVWTTLGGQPFHFNLDGQEKIADGDRMTIGFDLARGSLFAKDTEERL